MEIKLTVIPSNGTNNQVRDFSNCLDAIKYLSSITPDEEKEKEEGEEDDIADLNQGDNTADPNPEIESKTGNESAEKTSINGEEISN